MRSNRTLNYFAKFVKRIPDLNGREKEVVLGRLRRKTHVSIGKKWDLTEGRIRQIEDSALTKIRSKSRQLVLFKVNKKTKN